MVNIRNIALSSIIEIIEEGKKSHYVTNKTVSGLDVTSRDKAFYLKLVEGTVERKITLDFIINKYSKVPVNKQKKVVRNLLRMSIYQIIYLDKTLDAAACDEAVKIIKKRKMASLSGFINGVLRTIVREKENIINAIEEAPLEIKYSVPNWIIEKLGEDASFVLDSLYKERPINARFNTTKHSYEEIRDMLLCEGIKVKDNPYFKDIKDRAQAALIEDFSDLRNYATFAGGLFTIQDSASMIPVLVSDAKPGDMVIDVCAAPGGKSTQIAEMVGDKGFVHSFDVSDNKVDLIKENIKRLKLTNIDAQVFDGRNTNKKYIEKADVVILDVPCSGLGVISNKPDIKYRLKEEDIESLNTLQKEIVSSAIPYLKKGGRLIYSTCTLTKEEDEDMYKYILDNFDVAGVNLNEYLPDTLKCEDAKKGFLKLVPGKVNMDGFFVAGFVKN